MPGTRRCFRHIAAFAYGANEILILAFEMTTQVLLSLNVTLIPVCNRFAEKDEFVYY